MTPKQLQEIERCAQHILDVRARYPERSLAELYDPEKMPMDLIEAHKANDRAVDAAYGFKGKTDADRVKFLFELYTQLTKEPAQQAALFA